MTQELDIEMYDKYIESIDWSKDVDLPVAITIEEVLEPAEGLGAVIFPPTFAVARDALHPYQVDILDRNLTPQEAAAVGREANICQIDGVGSQANRMEPRFKCDPFNKLVPQITIKLKEGIEANLLDVGHRITDGAIRFSGMSDVVSDAIKSMRDNGNAELLAKLAPTSLIFGFWDSHPETTHYKFGRMIASTIRAVNVEIVRRSAQYNPTFDPRVLGLDDLPEDKPESQQTSQKAANEKIKPSVLGLDSVPSVNTHGGVRVYGRIVRLTQINLVRLRALAVTENSKINHISTLKLRRYILGLALVAARAQTNYDLREGCLLRCIDSKSLLVYTNKENCAFEADIKNIFTYAKVTADEFGVGETQTFDFDINKVKQTLNNPIKKSKKK